MPKGSSGEAGVVDTGSYADGHSATQGIFVSVLYSLVARLLLDFEVLGAVLEQLHESGLNLSMVYP